ncbi:proto-oncogene tyrosine-protein kinase ros [Lasius niger]|uniref:receptor protein-tyrosine kinase n=1 Tax=Lasius niger TaxID=67767 RepID=A0A0J7JYJ2_LASNI|nr:proto-oncogene tyrosine-protein kinase ros [Lasius niger]
MWEITSLGEHPYPTKTNEEVLQYVREGGKLPKPLNCPPTLYKLMQNCWSAENDRPNFRRCVENIVALKGNTQDAILRSVDIIKHSEVNQ